MFLDVAYKAFIKIKLLKIIMAKKIKEGKIRLMPQEGKKINIIHRKIKFNKPLVITGFQGIGLVGALSAQYIVNKLRLEQIGYIESEELPPLAMLEEGSLMHPIRIFSNKERDLVVIESELPIPIKLVYKMSAEIVRWLKKIKARGLVCFEGIGVPPEEKEDGIDVYSISTTKKLRQRLENFVPELKRGIIIGMSAALLLESKDEGINASCLMSESRADIPDRMAAAAIIKKFNQIYRYNINTAELEKEAREFEKKLEKLLSHVRKFSKLAREEKPPKIYG